MRNTIIGKFFEEMSDLLFKEDRENFGLINNILLE